MHKLSSLTVTDAAFPATPQFIFAAAVHAASEPFRDKVGLMLMWKSGVKIEYSFDGSAVDGNLESGMPSAAKALDFVSMPRGAIWFRAASSSTIDVEAWDQ